VIFYSATSAYYLSVLRVEKHFTLRALRKDTEAAEKSPSHSIKDKE